MSRMRVLLVGLPVIVACASGKVPTPDPLPSDVPARTVAGARYDADLITEEELDESPLGDVDALTIIKQLRPRFLSYRGLASASDGSGGRVQVMVDNGRLTSLEILSSIRRSEIHEIRYLGAAAAAQRFGSLSKAGPVILLRRR